MLKLHDKYHQCRLATFRKRNNPTFTYSVVVSLVRYPPVFEKVPFAIPDHPWSCRHDALERVWTYISFSCLILYDVEQVQLTSEDCQDVGICVAGADRMDRCNQESHEQGRVEASRFYV